MVLVLLLYTPVCRAPHGARGLKPLAPVPVAARAPSRPAWGAWIETGHSRPDARPARSRPAWGAWIETNTLQVETGSIESRPAWGAWIETAVMLALLPDMFGRAPHGARGLKPMWYDVYRLCKTSRPAWGAWIETMSTSIDAMSYASRPAWGAWIETQ